MKVLISAFAFSPYRGSECAVGWNIVNELSKIHDVTVICGDVRFDCRTKKELECYYGEKWHLCNHSLHIEYVPPTKGIALLERIHYAPGLWGLYYLAYNRWQKRAFKRAKVLCQERQFDLVYQLNMIGYREPGYMWKLGIPFVWGPVGGAPNEPIAFHMMFSWCGCIKVALRTVLNEVQKRLCLRARKAAKVAQKIWAVTDDDYRMIHNLWGAECEKMVETGTILRKDGRVRTWDGTSPLRIIWSGIHTSRKALPILLRALAMCGSSGWRLDILGEGPETEAWKCLAEKLGIADGLEWHGRVSHENALKIMNDGHVLAFPSLKEGTPHVVLEALSLGLPVICHDACGMGVVVTKECGFKMPLKDPNTSINGFSNAILSILRKPHIVSEMSVGALKRAKELIWSEKVKAISSAFEIAVSRRQQ